MNVLVIALLAVLGLVVGSFLGAFSFRWPKGVSVASGRSFCPRCKSKIAWFDNIPLLSFILLGGKCRNCQKPISLRYPLIEAATSIVFIFLGLIWTNALNTHSGFFDSWRVILGGYFLPFWLFLLSVLIAAFVIDFEHQLIPDNLVYLLFVSTSSVLLIFESAAFFNHFAAGMLASWFLLLLVFVTRGRGMGLGDVKLALPLGMLLGWPGALVWLFLSFLTGGLFAILLLVLRKASFGKKIAFGPFLILGFVLALFWGERIIRLVGL
jgi:leader peptidase (prepilin peptidase)/N-methyltransferase